MKVDLATMVAPNGTNVSNGNTIIQQKQPDYFPPDDQMQNNSETEPHKIAAKTLDEAIELANEAFKEVNIAFKYSIDKKTNRKIVEIINAETREQIRQIPPEEIVNMLSRMYDLLGILVDTKA